MYKQRMMEIESIHSARHACGLGCRNCVCEDECAYLMNAKETYFRKAFQRMRKLYPMISIPERRVK